MRVTASLTPVSLLLTCDAETSTDNETGSALDDSSLPTNSSHRASERAEGSRTPLGKRMSTRFFDSEIIQPLSTLLGKLGRGTRGANFGCIDCTCSVPAGTAPESFRAVTSLCPPAIRAVQDALGKKRIPFQTRRILRAGCNSDNSSAESKDIRLVDRYRIQEELRPPTRAGSGIGIGVDLPTARCAIAKWPRHSEST
jgi:hypothetical protein